MSTRLERLVEVYASDLARLAPAHNGQFGCPVCLRAFAGRSNMSDVVSEEHVIPRALGGRLITLTCRECNNSAGSELDSHLVRRVRIESGDPVAFRMSVGDAVQRGEFFSRTDCDPYTLRIVAQQSDPKQEAETVRLLTNGIDEINLTLNFGYVPIRSTVALIRSAYLLMFRTFGYRYVFDKSTEVLRNQIASPLEETNLVRAVTWELNSEVPEQTCLAVTRWSDNTHSFLALLKLDVNSNRMAGVVIPPPNVDGEAFYQRFAALENKSMCNLSWFEPGDTFLPLLKVWRHYSEETI